MKKIFTLLCGAVALMGYSKANAQSFSMERDTVFFTAVGTSTQYIYDTVAPTSSAVTLKWNVVSTNFPADWISPGSGICDNNLCYPSSLLTPSGNVKTSMPYPVTGTGHGFDMQFYAGSITTSGTYYMRVKLVNPAAVDSAYATFVVTATAPVGVNNVNKGNEELSLYPNPANNEINLVYGGNSEIKTAAIYNIIGKTMAVYKISGNSANMSLENMPGGIYFVRLSDAQGQIVATRKFTKQ